MGVAPANVVIIAFLPKNGYNKNDRLLAIALNDPKYKVYATKSNL